jgi:hypothetical protein
VRRISRYVSGHALLENNLNPLDNDDMSTKIKGSGIDPLIMADAQLVAECVASGRPIPPEVSQRVQQRGEQIRKRVFQEHGLVNIAVPGIREFRDQLSE